VNICQEKVGEYLDVIEESLGTTSAERFRKIEELNSLDEMEVTIICDRFVSASNQAAYLRALAMALVRANRKSQYAHLANS